MHPLAYAALIMWRKIQERAYVAKAILTYPPTDNTELQAANCPSDLIKELKIAALTKMP